MTDTPPVTTPPAATPPAPNVAELKQKLDEFRENNRVMHAQLEQLKQQYSGIDPEAFKRMREEFDKAKEGEEKTLLQQGKFEELFARKLDPIRQDFTAKLTAAQEKAAQIQKERDAYFDSLKTVRVDTAAQAAAAEAKVSVRPEAMRDFASRMRELFAIDEKGNVIAQGAAKYRGTDGADMTPKEAVAELLQQAPHLFVGSVGGGAGGGSGSMPRGAVIDRSDTKAYLANLEKVAKGEVKVR